LEELPTRVDALTSEVSHLRSEVSHLSSEVSELNSEVSELRDEMRVEFSAVRGEITKGDEETRRVLRDEIRAGDARVMEQVRVLHEDVVGRLALIQEGLSSKRLRRKTR
jgi:predicted RNase H-like nuclease (RuvC/YqgF family)